MRRTYYDHEPVYQRLAAAGGMGWDDRAGVGGVGGGGAGSYEALGRFLASGLCPAAPAAGGAIRAIDLGCGGGQGAILLARRGFQVTGVDFAPTAVALGRANAAAARVEATFAVADCLDLSELAPGGAAGGSFALAVDNHTLHCLIGDDRRRYLAGAARLLAPGGTLFCETMSAEGMPDFGALGVDPVSRMDRHRTRYWVGRDELLAELAACGLDVADVQSRRQRDRPDPGDLLVVVARKRADG
jgi:SAM-dependent methyltransferase